MVFIGVKSGNAAAKIQNVNGVLSAIVDVNFIPTSYQWFRDNVVINGATQSTYNTNGVAGAYKCVVTGSYTTKESSITVVAEYLLTENGQPLLTEDGQPLEIEYV